jgi:hypothetical protein
VSAGYRRFLRRSGAPYLDPNSIEAVDLDDIVFTNKVKVLAAGGLSALCPPDTHHFDETPAIDHPITRPDMAGNCDLSCAT